MSNVFYRNRDDIILGLCSHIVNIASQRADKFLDEPNSNKDKWLEYYAEYLSIIIQTIIWKAKDKLAEEDKYKYLVDETFLLATWLAVETRGFFLNVQQKVELLKEIRQLCTNRIDYYFNLPDSDPEIKEKIMRGKDTLYKNPLYIFAREISRLDGSHPNIGKVVGENIVVVKILEGINIDQFLQWYETCDSS
jgi:hypothetical protein